MSNQRLEGGGLFEITDYTTASDWERFIADLEEILSEWKLHRQTDGIKTYCELPQRFISSGLWHEKIDVLKFGNVAFDVKYQFLDDSNLKASERNELEQNATRTRTDSKSSDDSEFQDPMGEDEDSANLSIPKEEEKDHGEYELPVEMPECLKDIIAYSNDYASKAHCIVRWYSLRRFIVLSPKGDTIVTEDKVKLLLSSASVALANIDCHVPIFIQIHNPKNNFYQGISEHLNIRTMYEMVFFRKSLKQYSYLSELISLFREKTNSSLNDPIDATIRLNYCLSTFDLFLENKDQFAGNEHSDDDQDELVKMTRSQKKATSRKVDPRVQDLRSGATFEQVVDALDDCVPHSYKILKFLHVAALWPPLSDKVITDSQVHSDLDPTEAPIWTIRCVTSDNCNMKLVHETQVVYELLKSAVDFAYDKMDGSQVFQNCDKDILKLKCLKLSYELSLQPEVVLSEDPSDNLRKLIALLFFRATELYGDVDALDQVAGQVRKKPSLSEVYKDFRKQKPSVKEFIIRNKISRPFEPISSPALPQRMFCTVCDEEFRLCGAFSELCN